MAEGTDANTVRDAIKRLVTDGLAGGGELSRSDALCLVLLCADGLTIPEIAEVTGMPAPAVVERLEDALAVVHACGCEAMGGAP